MGRPLTEDERVVLKALAEESPIMGWDILSLIRHLQPAKKPSAVLRALMKLLEYQEIHEQAMFERVVDGVRNRFFVLTEAGLSTYLKICMVESAYQIGVTTCMMELHERMATTEFIDAPFLLHLAGLPRKYYPDQSLNEGRTAYYHGFVAGVKAVCTKIRNRMDIPIIPLDREFFEQLNQELEESVVV
jgi:hypothetical protein